MTETHASSVAERIFAILRTFDGAHPVMSMSQIARRSELPPATVHRMLQKLLAAGALERASDGTYRIGLLLWRLGTLSPVQQLSDGAGRAQLARLGQALEAVVRVHAFSDCRAMCVQEAAGRLGTDESELGNVLPLSQRAPGVVLAAGLTSRDRSRIPLTRPAYDQLERRIRQLGDAGSIDIPCSRGVEIAVTIDRGEELPMALSAVIDRDRASDRAVMARSRRGLVETAANLSRALRRGECG